MLRSDEWIAIAVHRINAARRTPCLHKAHHSVMQENSADTMPRLYSERDRILQLWNTARMSGEEVCLATLVGVRGSSYRKTGAKILVTKSGLRAGTVSGGCLEAEICRKIWWLTRNGSRTEKFATSSGDSDSPLGGGLGCGGLLDILYERGRTAATVMECIRLSAERQERLALVRVIESNDLEVAVGTTMIAVSGQEEQFIGQAPLAVQTGLKQFIDQVFSHQQNQNAALQFGEIQLQVFGEYVASPPSLLLFGAGDDAKPLVEISRLLGWQVTVCDARGHLVTPERFPNAQKHVRLDLHNPLDGLDIPRFDAVVMMTHSVEQDRELLKALLAEPARYMGLLGARHRTRQLVAEAANSLGLDYDNCMAALHSPIGLAIGAETPEAIALSVAAEIQAVLSARTSTAPQINVTPEQTNLFWVSRIAHA
jgi:xanthine dehydrogenase accessory factor